MIPKIVLTQGDALALTLTCSGQDLTGATLSTYLPITGGSELEIDNSAHTVDPDQMANVGKFSVEITTEQSEQLREGTALDIVTRVTQGSSVVHFHGKGLLTVKTINL